jgi:hypothetical protein
LRSFTALRERIDDISTKGVVLKIHGRPDTRLTVRLESPARVSLTQRLGQLAESSEMLFSGEFPKESAMLHRLVFEENYAAAFSVADEDGGDSVNWYYVRVVQANGQMDPLGPARSGWKEATISSLPPRPKAASRSITWIWRKAAKRSSIAAGESASSALRRPCTS